MVDAWPATLPEAGLNGISGGPQSNAVSFTPQQGPTIDRKAASSVVRKYQVQLPPIDRTTYGYFITFFETTLNYGVLPFTMTDPFTNTTKQYKFVQNNPVYVEQWTDGQYVNLQFQLVRLN